jgi:putative transcriptional regulator
MPYLHASMQTVIETEAYLRAAKDAGMATEEMTAAVDLVASDPQVGDVMQGTGGGPQGPPGRPRQGQVRRPSHCLLLWRRGHPAVPADRLRQGRESQPDPRRAQCPAPADGNLEGESELARGGSLPPHPPRASKDKIMSKAFDKIAAGLADAIAFAEGDTAKGRVAAGPDVKAIRAKTKLSQAKFAEKLHIPVATVRDWEQHRRSPDAPARTLLGMVNADPKAAMKLLERASG